MLADAQIAPVARLLADETRVTMLMALVGGRALPACDLALYAAVSPSTASLQLGKLIEGRLVIAEKRGRYRYYHLANPMVAGALESLAQMGPAAEARSFREGQRARAIRLARTCYDHIAGLLGVRLAAALVADGSLKATAKDFQLTAHGEHRLRRLGVDVEAARRSRRAFARACLDWSERTHHLAGALGEALLQRLLVLRWVERVPESRALTVCDRGRRALREQFGISLTPAVDSRRIHI